MNVVAPDSNEGLKLKEFVNAQPGSLWTIDHSRFKNFLYVRCTDGWVCIKSGNLDHKQIEPVSRFLNQFINKEKIINDKASTGHYFFH